MKPRQVISIFNSILTFSAGEKGNPPFNFDREHIKIGTHAILSELALGTLNLYELMYEGFKDFVAATFTTAPQCMLMTDVNDLLASSSDFCSHLNLHKKKQLLFECGLLGLCLNRIDYSGRVIVESIFEYLLPESLALAAPTLAIPDSVVVIHPMFYSLLRIKLNPKISVLPGRLRDMNIISTLSSSTASNNVDDSISSWPQKHKVPPINRTKVFISYSHKDKKMFDEFKTMLTPFIQKGLVEFWDDTKINPGVKWQEEIRASIASSKVAVLLVSKDFLASDFITKNELPPLLKAAQEEGVKIFWICTSSCLHKQTAIDQYQAAHDINRPLDKLKKGGKNGNLEKYL